MPFTMRVTRGQNKCNIKDIMHFVKYAAPIINVANRANLLTYNS